MRVLNVAGRDVAGVGYRTQQAFARHAPEWTFDHVATRSSPWGYPGHRPASMVGRLARRADVVHLHNHFRMADHFRIDKPLVITHHGSRFRKRHIELLAEQEHRGAIGLVTTLDLWLMAPDELEWAPPCYDLDALAAMRRPHDGQTLRIGHAPTNRAIKGTEAFLHAVNRLARETPVELVLIEGQTWADCLALKATCNLYFDQVALGYGCNAIESWAMGIPVIAGAQPSTLDEMCRRFGGLPFVDATEDTIYDALRTLADPTARTLWGQVGLQHVRQHHDAASVVKQLMEVYSRAA